MTSRELRQWSIAQRLYVLQTQPTDLFGNIKQFYRELRSDIVDEANALYGEYLYENASVLYGRALHITRHLFRFGDDIRFNDDKPLLYNRIQCFLKLGYYWEAVDDCDLVLENESTYNHVRIDKAEALFKLGLPEECLKTLSYFTTKQRESNPRIGFLIENLRRLGFMFSTDESSTRFYHGVNNGESWKAQGARPKNAKESPAPFIGGKKKQSRKHQSKSADDKLKPSPTKMEGTTCESDNDSDTSVASEISESELVQSLRGSGQPVQIERSDPIDIPLEGSGISVDSTDGEWRMQRKRRNTVGDVAKKNSPRGSEPNNDRNNAGNISKFNTKVSSPNNTNGSGDFSKKSKRRRHKSDSAKNTSNGLKQGSNTLEGTVSEKVLLQVKTSQANLPVSKQSLDWEKILNLKLACRNCFSKTAYFGRLGNFYHGDFKNHNCLKDLLICPDTEATKLLHRPIWCQIRDRVKKDFFGEYQLCAFYQSDQPCKVPSDNCAFPHTESEKVVWIAERNGTFNRNDVINNLKLKSLHHKTNLKFTGNTGKNAQKQRGVVMVSNQKSFVSDEFNQLQPTTPVLKPTIPIQQPPTPVLKPTVPILQPTTPVLQPTMPVLQQTPVSQPIYGGQMPFNSQQQAVKFPNHWQQNQVKLPRDLSFGNCQNFNAFQNKKHQTTQSSGSLLGLPPQTLVTKNKKHQTTQSSGSLLGLPPQTLVTNHVPVVQSQHPNVVRRQLSDSMDTETRRLKLARQQSVLVDSLLSRWKGCFTFMCQQCLYSSPPCISYKSKDHPEYCGHSSRHPWPISKILAHEIHENGRIKRSFIRTKLPNNVPDKCRHFFKAYGCVRGETCNFAHSIIELEIWKLEQTHGINREFLVDYCGFMAPTTGSGTVVKVKKPDLPQSKQPEAFPFNLKLICGTCWSRGGQQQDRSLKNPLTCNAGHSWRDKICIVFSEVRQKWIQVNGRHPDLKPYITPKMCKNQSKCDYGNVHGRQCLYCHSEEEIIIWNYMLKHKIKSLDEIVKGNKSNSTEKRKVTQDGSYRRTSPGFYCSYCEMDFRNIQALDFHTSTLKHKQCVNSDTERSWKYRSPPLDVLNGHYVLCKRHEQHRCRYSDTDPANNACNQAHSQDELQEWKERHKYRMMKKEKARQCKLFSFMDQLLLEYNLSTSEVKVMTEGDLPQIRLICDKKLNSFISAVERKLDEKFEESWKFEVECIEGERKLKRVGLLYDEHRLHFSLSHPKAEESPQVCPGNMIIDGNTYTIEVKFITTLLGSFHQWVVFDFGKKPVLVRKLHVHVGAEEDRPKYMKQSSLMESTVIWDTSNTEILQLPKQTIYEEELLKKYKPPSTNLNIDDLNVGVLSKDNYKHRMHKMVSLEERGRMRIINRFHTATEMHISSTITVESYAGTELLIGQNGELYGKILLTETLNCDSESSQLIMESVENVFCKFDSESNQAYELKIVSDESIDGRTKDHIFVYLNEICVNKQELQAGTIKKVEVQFQLNRFPFCQMHYAIDSLKDMDAILPSPGNALDILKPVDHDKQVEQEINSSQKQAIDYMYSAGTSTVNGPPLVIYGPFGTGKTHTMAESVKRILQRHETKILICTMSNSGADLYITKYLDDFLQNYPKGKRPKPTILRVYQANRRIKTIHPDVQKYCLIDEETGKINLPAKKDVMRSRVVISTLNMTLYLAGLNLKGHFTHILIDEAGQALETQAIMPLSMADWKTCVAIAGDHIQMSPKVYSEEARIGGFDISILQRLHEHYQITRDENTIFLHYNYRTCEEILSFVSVYYKTKLISMIDHPLHPTIHPLSFYAVKGTDHLVGTSYLNRDEVVELGFRVEELYRSWPHDQWGKEDIGVITPYDSQVREIRQELRRRKLNDVTVENVRNVQGKEFRALFISVVRTRATLVKTHVTAKHNDPGESAEFNYGLLSDEKLLNTAFTRAKSLLAIVGDPITMCSIGRCSKVWEKFIKKCEGNGSLHPDDVTLQRVHAEIEAVNTQLNPFATPFTPKPITEETNIDRPLDILTDIAVASKTTQPSIWENPQEVKLSSQINEDFPSLSAVEHIEQETYVSGDFMFYQEVPEYQAVDEWQSEEDEEIDVKKIDDSILRELRRHVQEARQRDAIPDEADLIDDTSESSSNLNESRGSDETSFRNVDSENESIESIANSVKIDPIEINTNIHEACPKKELEEIVKQLFVPQKDRSNLQGEDFFDEYDPESDTSSEELDQEASENKYKPLLESEPEKYKRCKFYLDVRGQTYATTLEDDIPIVICIMSKYNRGRALNNDEVIVEIQQNEDVLEEVDVKELDFKPENDDVSGRVYGRVVHVLRRASDPYLRKIVCTLDQFSNSLMVPVNKEFPKLCISKMGDNNKSSVEDTTVAIYTLTKHGQVFDRNVVVTNKDRRHKLFVVRYWKWTTRMTYPLGFVTEELPAGNDQTSGLKILKLIHGVEDTWKNKVREELYNQFPDNWTIPNEEIKKRIDFRKFETITIDPKGCQDIDDAISICRIDDNHYEVGVHIADVSYFVTKDSLLDTEAKKRATSYYPAMSASPVNMLPSRLSNDLCSLQPEKDRLAISVFMSINSNGLHCTAGTKIVRTVIRSRRKLTYEEAEDIILDQNENTSIVVGIHKLNELAQKSRANRLKEGRFSYNVDDSEGEISCPLAHSLIEEFMILANKAVAQYLMTVFPQCVPLRRQLPPDPVKLQEFQMKHVADIRNSKEMMGRFNDYVTNAQCNCDKDCTCGQQYNTITMQTREWNQLVKLVNDIEQGTDASQVDMLKIINIVCTDSKHPKLSVMMAHYYMTQEKSNYFCSGDSITGGSDLGHHSLAVEFYTHFTSPIRRYIDVVVHRLIDNALRGEDAPYTKEDISSICYHSSIQSSNAKFFEKRTKTFMCALKLKEASLSYLPAVEQASERSINFVFPSFMPINQKFVGINKLKPSKRPDVNEETKTNIVWKQRIYDAKAKPEEVLPKMDRCTWELDKDRFVVTFNSTLWKELLSGIEDDDIHQIRAALYFAAQEINAAEKEKEKRTLVKCQEGKLLKKEVTSEILDRHGNRYHFVEFQREYSTGDMLEVKLSAGFERGLLEPKIQLFNLTPEFDICLEHRSDPITCFSQLATKKPRGATGVISYQKRWLAVLSMSSASNAVSEDDTVIIRNISISWNFVKDDLGNKLFNGIFSLPVDFCLERGIRLNGIMNYNTTKDSKSEDSKSDDEGCYDYICVRYSGIEVQQSSHNRHHVKSTWVGHCYTTMVHNNETNRTRDISIRLNQSASELPHSVLYPKPGTHPLCTIELISKGKSDMRLEEAVKKLNVAKPSLNRDIALLKKHKMGGREDDVTAKKLPDLAKKIKVGRIPGVDLPPPNDIQKEAIQTALAKPFTVIQGPPGTGKTVTGSQLAYYFSEMNKKIPPTGKGTPQVLYCGPSNKSVDVVAGYLKKFPELSIVRVYSETIEKKDFPLPWEKDIGRKIETREISTDPEHVGIALHHLIRSNDNSHSADIRKMDRDFQRLKPGIIVPKKIRSAYKELITRAKEEEFKKHRIILATCNAAGSLFIGKFCSIIQCIIDEAGMCSEPESLIPLVKCLPYQVVLIGDHKQLRPIITEKYAEEFGMGISLLERYESRTKMLTIQYRMHHKICEFPSSAFYNNKLVTAESVVNRKGDKLRIWPAGKTCPTVFCHVYGKEETLTVNSSEGSEQSKSNPQEVYHVVRIACKLLEKGIKPKNIVILSQYRLQCQRIRDTLKERGHEEVAVSTVVLSQGSEWDYVIMSTVRSLPRVEIEKKPSIRWMKMNLGFIIDENQMNVALTRAKRGLILIGNQYLLRTHPKWDELLKRYHQNKCIVDPAANFPYQSE